MPDNITVGQLGEEAACRYLTDRGYRIIDRNFKRPWGELDIIAIEPKTKILAFIEVKTLTKSGNPANEQAAPIAGFFYKPSGENHLKPEDNLTHAKLEKLKRAASLYAGHRPELVTGAGWRIDLIAIDLGESSSVFRHYRNIAA
ncbi:MAG: YraN family protein [Patescibacteria group bacterium]